MVQRDTPPPSPDMVEHMDDEEEMIYGEDIVEVIDAQDVEDNEEMEVMDGDSAGDGDATHVFRGHKFGSIFCGSLNKNGTLAITGGEEDRAYVWDTSSGEIILDCTGHKDSVIFAEFNFDETYVATGDMSGLIQVWKLSDKSRVWEYSMGDATWMKWHMAANVLIAGSVDGEIYVWKIPDGDCKVFQGYGCRAETAAILPDGKRIAVGYEDGNIRVIDLKTCSVISSIPPNLGHSATITTLDCHHDNNLIISAAVDGKTILSVSQTGKIISVLQSLNVSKSNNAVSSTEEGESNSGENDSNWVETVAFCKDPEFPVAATGTLNGEIFVWDVSKQVLRHKMEQESGVSKLVWKGTTSLLFSAGLDGILRCYNAKNGQCLRSFTGHTADILDLYISEDETKALTASDDSTARIFDLTILS